MPDFAKAGATYITFHPEYERARRPHHRPGSASTAASPAWCSTCDAARLARLHARPDRHGVLMSVNPGFGGCGLHQRAAEDQARALSPRAAARSGPEVDPVASEKPDNIRTVAAAGAVTFVAGSGDLRQQGTAATITQMRSEIAAAAPSAGSPQAPGASRPETTRAAEGRRRVINAPPAGTGTPIRRRRHHHRPVVIVHRRRRGLAATTPPS